MLFTRKILEKQLEQVTQSILLDDEQMNEVEKELVNIIRKTEKIVVKLREHKDMVTDLQQFSLGIKYSCDIVVDSAERRLIHNKELVKEIKTELENE